MIVAGQPGLSRLSRSFQALCSLLFFFCTLPFPAFHQHGAPGGSRTPTPFGPWILCPGRLPFRHRGLGLRISMASRSTPWHAHFILCLHYILPNEHENLTRQFSISGWFCTVAERPVHGESWRISSISSDSLSLLQSRSMDSNLPTRSGRNTRTWLQSDAVSCEKSHSSR